MIPVLSFQVNTAYNEYNERSSYEKRNIKAL